MEYTITEINNYINYTYKLIKTLKRYNEEENKKDIEYLESMLEKFKNLKKEIF